MKRGRIAFSFGYLVTKERKRSDGGRDLLEIDIYEVSVTPQPMNNRTRILSTKSAAAATRLSEEELETFRALRQEWEAEKTAEAAAKEEEEMQLSVYRNRVPPRPPDPDRVISICGVRVKAVKVRVNHGQ